MSKFTITNMVMLEDKGKVLVVNRIKSFQGIAFPGGHLEPGESIYDSAIREFRKETGLCISDLESKGFNYWDIENGDKYFVYLYTAKNYSGTLIEETYEGKVFWLEKEKLANEKLAPDMDIYLKMFEGNYSECFCCHQDGYVPHYK